MKSRFAIIFSALAAVSPGIARADSKADATAIRALYTRVEQAFKNKDIQEILATGGPDFKLKEPNGKLLDGKQMEQQLRMQFTVLKTIDTATIKPHKIAVKGNEATVTYDYAFSGFLADPKGQPSNHSMGQTGTSRDTLSRTKEGWKLKLMERLTQVATFDGKPMNPPAGGSKSASSKK